MTRRPLVFLCHASEDKARIMKYYEQLRRSGLTPWLDKKDLNPGDEWESVIRDVIRRADFVLIFLSEVTLRKRGFVQREIKFTLDVLEEIPDGQLHTIPVRIDDAPVIVEKLPEKLRKLQICDAFKRGGFRSVIETILRQPRRRRTRGQVKPPRRARLTTGSQARFMPPSSTIISTPSGREVYVAHEAAGMVFGFDEADTQHEAWRTSISPGRPHCLVLAPMRREILVVDATTDTVVVIDQRSKTVKARIAVGRNPRSIAITPDEKKAYVSNEQPVPQGNISVLDLVERVVIKSIRGVNCPEGIALSPDGTKLYVASQGGAGQDPVFIVNTTTDTVVGSIAGLAVGSRLIVTPDGSKAYVMRGGFHTRDPKGEGIVSVPDQVSVIDTKTNRVIRHLEMNATYMASTKDGRYVLACCERSVSVIDAHSDAVTNVIPLGSTPVGVTVTRDMKAYVWIPDEQRVFLVGLHGLLRPSLREHEESSSPPSPAAPGV